MADTCPYVVLLRHGAAVPKEVDPDRPLDADGVIQASTAGLEIAAALAGYGVKEVLVQHSPLTRARQTAEYVAKELSSAASITAEVQEGEGLSPKDSPEKLLARLLKQRPAPHTAVVLVRAVPLPPQVGHLPQLYLLSQLMEFDLLKETDFPDAGGLLVEYPDASDAECEWELLRQFN